MNSNQYLKIIKEGVTAWNNWRNNNPNIIPKLDGLDLSQMELKYIDIWHIEPATILSAGSVSWDLIGIDFSNCSLKNVKFNKSDLASADFSNSDITGADFSEAQISEANFENSKLLKTKFEGASISKVNFSNLDLSEVSFQGAQSKGDNNFNNCILDKADFFNSSITIHEIKVASSFKGTIFSRNKLEVPKLVQFRRLFFHQIGEETHKKMVTEMDLYNEESGVYHSCFISYSSKDEIFVEKLHSDLVSRRVKCFFAPKDISIGDKIRPTIYEAIKNHSKLLLVISAASIESNWVENEVESAFEEENRLDQNILFPIRIDEVVFYSENSWSSTIRRQRHMGNFENWENESDYRKSLEKLLHDLRVDKERNNKPSKQ